ncbi:hypothetical protein BN1049_02208 [Pseudomonas saudimassiliensis]|uniref:Uncharacterized protein n=1 Tax=Pseudomonas saudimassiliensis TaxID=1461581 RepID=A0A078MHA8_9PSED|nr:HPP family protein [Pseudomonas saudimassiliensis]CEA05680.1 hypothetical protein BN1049_02208 [Pseudomonas saudimassiliensis]CEF27261.1 hypothetical protein BN1049_02208 [Pseudomonas saudimassiliensis]
MFSRKSLTLPPQLDWQHKDEPALAEWSLKARPYNTDIANGIAAFFLIVQIPCLYWLLPSMASDLGDQLLIGGLLYMVVMSGAFSMTHQTTKFAYRLTSSGLEFCEWKEFPEWLPRLLKWAGGITGVAMLMLATVHPAALIGAIAGPGLMGLMYLRMGTSSQFRRMHEQFHQGFHPWTDFTRMIVFRRRAIIGLDFTYFNPMSDEGKGRMIDTDRLLYCRKAQLDDLITIIREQLPESTPYEEAYIPIYA